jgi:arylsulfatase A-like enzyme
MKLQWQVNNIGRLIRYLKEKNLYDQTIIVFLSDNGPEGNTMNIGAPWSNERFEDWGKKGTFIQYGAAWAQAGVGPYRMFKGFTSEGGIKAPLVIAGYGVSGSGRIVDSLTHVTDLPATFLSLAGVSYPKIFEGENVFPLQGKVLSPVLNATQRSVRGQNDWIGWELFGNRAIRQGNWKLLWLCKPFGPSQWELYDLEKDPGETINLAERRPKLRDQMLRRWNAYAKDNNVILPNASPVCQVL